MIKNLVILLAVAFGIFLSSSRCNAQANCGLYEQKTVDCSTERHGCTGSFTIFVCGIGHDPCRVELGIGGSCCGILLPSAVPIGCNGEVDAEYLIPQKAGLGLRLVVLNVPSCRGVYTPVKVKIPTDM
jgi:hypothetical protein